MTGRIFCFHFVGRYAAPKLTKSFGFHFSFGEKFSWGNGCQFTSRAGVAPGGHWCVSDCFENSFVCCLVTENCMSSGPNASERGNFLSSYKKVETDYNLRIYYFSNYYFFTLLWYVFFSFNPNKLPIT